MYNLQKHQLTLLITVVICLNYCVKLSHTDMSLTLYVPMSICLKMIARLLSPSYMYRRLMITWSCDFAVTVTYLYFSKFQARTVESYPAIAVQGFDMVKTPILKNFMDSRFCKILRDLFLRIWAKNTKSAKFVPTK